MKEKPKYLHVEHKFQDDWTIVHPGTYRYVGQNGNWHKLVGTGDMEDMPVLLDSQELSELDAYWSV